MLSGDETGDQTQNLGGAALRLEQDFFVRDELLRRGGDGTIAHNRHLGNFQYVRVRIVGLC
jgi:hypothetical protein